MIKPNEITAVVVSYYRADRLKICLDSLKLCPNRIVWDNSGDRPDMEEDLKRIKDLEKSYSDVRFFYTPENIGYAGAINRGIINSKTDWVLLTTDDMIFEENWFDLLNEVLTEKPHLEQIHLNAWNAMVFHKKTIARMGWWDERYRIYPSCEDDDWYLRTIEHLGYSPYTAPNPGFNFPIEYIEGEIWPYTGQVEELHDRDDNFTYFFNSPYSKYPILGKETITGGKLDAGTRNDWRWNQENTEVQKRAGNDSMNGLDWQHEKWQLGFFPGVGKTSGFLMAKDGRFWKRKKEDIDHYPAILEEYRKKYTTTAEIIFENKNDKKS